MTIKIQILISIAFSLIISACSLFTPYRLDIPQGNILKQEDVSQLKIAMTKAQVRFLLGDPIIQDPFNKEKWNYVQLEQPGNKPIKRRNIYLYFEGDKLVKMEGDLEAPE